MDNNSLARTKWNCMYHIVFIPKYWRKVMYREKKKDAGEILRKLCDYKGMEILEATVYKDPIHMCVKIPPKMSVSEFMGYLKEKSALIIFDRFSEYRAKGG